MNNAASASRPPRSNSVNVLAWSISVSVLAWLVIVASALGCLISAVTSLMFIAGSYGTAGGMTLEGLAIIAGPPATLLAGFGLLRRKRLAWHYMLVLTSSVLLWNGMEFLESPTPERTWISESGTINTVSATTPGYSLPLTGICIGLIVMLLSRGGRSGFVTSKTGTPRSAR